MSPQTLDTRVEKLDERVTILEQLPARVDALTLQISQLRGEVHAEFSATLTSLREEIRAGHEETRRQMRELHNVTLNLIGDLRAHMLMLHEDVISRFALAQNGKPRRGKRR